MRVSSGVGLVALMALFAAAACGDSSGPGGGSALLFVNTTYVQYDTADVGAEGSQMEFTLKKLGIAVTYHTAIDSASLAAALRTTGVFIIPEQEVKALALDLSPGAKLALRQFVDSSGGTLIVNADGYGRLFGLLDTLFDYAIVAGATSATSAFPLNASAAAGTSFAGGLPVLYEGDATYAMEPTSLPVAARIIYQAPGGGRVAVTVIPQGRGAIVILAYDWYNAEPHGGQDGGWTEILHRALRN